jgi:hypothetical protein
VYSIRNCYNCSSNSSYNCTIKWRIHFTGHGVLDGWISGNVSILGWSNTYLCRYDNGTSGNGTSGNGTCGDDSNHSCTSNGSSNNVRDRSGKFGGNVGIQRWGRYCFFVL